MTDATAAQTPETTTQAQGSVPETNDGKNNGSGQVETAPKQQGGTQSGVKREFFNLREKIRTEREEKESLRAEFEAFKAQMTKSAGTGVDRKVDPLEDPEAYLSAAEKRARQAAGEEFNSRLAEHNRQVSALQANQMLRSRSHLQDDTKACDEVADILNSRYSHLRDLDPVAAAELSYSAWCKQKGIQPDFSDDQASIPPRHAKPSSAGSGTSTNNEVITQEEVKRTLAVLKDPAAINAYIAKVEKAAREGRYKGNHIRL